MAIGNHTHLRNKHQNIQIRKKFKSTPPYRCCGMITGNPNKFSTRYCCTYPQAYRRRDETFRGIIVSRFWDDERFYDY